MQVCRLHRLLNECVEKVKVQIAGLSTTITKDVATITIMILMIIKGT